MKTRSTNPVTSREAETTSRSSWPIVRTVVRRLVDEHGPLTHDALIRAYENEVAAGRARRSSPSSIRTRCNELERDGQVVVVDRFGDSDSGARASRYELAANTEQHHQYQIGETQ